MLLSAKKNWCRVGSTSGFRFRLVDFPRDSVSVDESDPETVGHGLMGHG